MRHQDVSGCLSLLASEDTVRRWPSANQEESYHGNLTMLAPWPQSSSLQNQEKISFYCGLLSLQHLVLAAQTDSYSCFHNPYALCFHHKKYNIFFKWFAFDEMIRSSAKYLKGAQEMVNVHTPWARSLWGLSHFIRKWWCREGHGPQTCLQRDVRWCHALCWLGTWKVAGWVKQPPFNPISNGANGWF